MKIPFSVFLATWSTVALGAPGDEGRHAADVIQGCRLVAESKQGRTQLEGMKWGVCIGVIQTLRIIGGHLQPNMRNCVTGNVTTEQLAKVVIRYADRNPQRLNDGIEVLAIEALKDVWPCKIARPSR